MLVPSCNARRRQETPEQRLPPINAIVLSASKTLATVKSAGRGSATACTTRKGISRSARVATSTARPTPATPTEQARCFRSRPPGFTVLYTFSAVDTGGHQSDGSASKARLIQDAGGKLYGTSRFGGTSGNRMVFSMTPAEVITGLHTFNAVDSDGAESRQPAAAHRAPLVPSRPGTSPGVSASTWRRTHHKNRCVPSVKKLSRALRKTTY